MSKTVATQTDVETRNMSTQTDPEITVTDFSEEFDPADLYKFSTVKFTKKGAKTQTAVVPVEINIGAGWRFDDLKNYFDIKQSWRNDEETNAIKHADHLN